MAELPEMGTVARIYRQYELEAEESPARGYLGGSEIGHPCERYLWLKLRGAERKKWDGRMLRLFEHGQREEERMAENLRSIGCELVQYDEKGEQYGFSLWGGLFSGHYDGVVRGIPEAPKTWHLWECKTHNRKSFEELRKLGVEASKPMHFAQMQIYMHMAELERALYTAINKDTDEIYVERVSYDKAFSQSLLDRAEHICFTDEPSPPLGRDASWYQCKGCEMSGICYGRELPKSSCRSCAQVTPQRDGTWKCEAGNEPDPIYGACARWVAHLNAIPWLEYKGLNEKGEAYGLDRNLQPVVIGFPNAGDEPPF